ncbi:hypothetical protein [Actinomarinicola tropica]|uniref:Uncharacterized protein n=1 Tax=Actinomarinicola tropica TaxID=2789776 RepID=A0A5Q2RLJ7_9ACTN|nr:hypothetical protein [Actinomarinicola tropica]QGG94947.1 hypothetical protein GH723_07395 [Actinomarinicola tropica]
MRRLTEEELAQLCQLARKGREGPRKAVQALWDLILLEAHGPAAVDDPSTIEPFWVQDYSIPAGQAETLGNAMVQKRRLPERDVSGIAMMWWNYCPSEYDDEAPAGP